MGDVGMKRALKRLEKDHREFLESPVPHVSAVPLESNMLEWHCNIKFKSYVFHLILFFSKEYPCVSPRAEIVPFGFDMVGITVHPGEKGEKLCLNILSDFANIHPEWDLLKGSGWSPSYTVQTLLLNLLSYFNDVCQDADPLLSSFLVKVKDFVCDDCGHCQDTPYPPLHGEEDDVEDASESDEASEVGTELSENDVTPVIECQKSDQLEVAAARIVDYVSRETFSTLRKSSQHQLFGYGLIFSELDEKFCPQTPCEFLTASSFFEMCETTGKATSILREDLSYFLPLYISADHSSRMQPLFEKTMTKIAKRFRLKFSLTNTFSHVTIKVFSHIMSKKIEECVMTRMDTAGNILEGYLQLHRTFLWVLEMYPQVRKHVEKRLHDFAANSSARLRKSTPKFECHLYFVLLSVSSEYAWESMSNIFLAHHWKHSLKHCLLLNPSLHSMAIPPEYRLQETFELSSRFCRQFALHVAFLKMAKPAELNRDELLQRYEANLCFPTQEMMSSMKDALHKINHEMNSFEDWFEFIGLPVPSKEELNETLKDCVRHCHSSRTYTCCRPRQSRR